MSEMTPALVVIPDTVQWRAEQLQMMNWGGFHGYHPVDFAAGSTLISGASGTGKSTLLDAYTALMMPSSVAFNGASNDATQGRARGSEQRNLVTYLRGKRDSFRDGDLMTDQVLRGDGEATWGALAMTFVNDLGERYTVLRTYFVSVACRDGSQVAAKFFTVDGVVDLRDLAPMAASRFDPRIIRARFSGLDAHGGAEAFIQAVATRLGIGSRGNEERALRLMGRIQAGRPFPTVDRLYKDLVLEDPGTYGAAKNAVKHFRALDNSFKELETSGEKERHLRRIADVHGQYLKARARAEQLDQFGVARDGDTPFQLWRLRTERRLLDEADAANRDAREQAAADQTRSTTEVGRLKVELGQVEEQQRANGGGALEQIAGQIQQAEAERQQVARARLVFETRTKALGLELVDAETFAESQQAARGFLGSVDEQIAELSQARDGLVARRPAVADRLELLNQERASLRNRQSQVPMAFDRVRNQIAEACGLRPAELPFAAELMDVAPEYAQWRLAAELTLHGVGLTLLMDERRQHQIRETIETLRLSPRVSFEGVALRQRASEPADPQLVSGRLVFKDSPFTGWVKNRVQQHGTDHLCVDKPSELGGDDPKVTINGQVSRGRRGAHGRNRDQEFILGFSNETRLRQISQDAAELTAALVELDQRKRCLADEVSTLTRRKEAYQVVLDTDWASLDADRVEAEIRRLEQLRETLLAKSDVLAELQRRHGEVEAALQAASRRLYGCEQRTQMLTKAWQGIVDAQDVVSNGLEQMERAGLVKLSEADADYISQQLYEREGSVDHERFTAAVDRLKQALASESVAQRRTARSAAESLEDTFATFNTRWDDPNRGSTVEAYPEFAAIYDEIIKHGLFERRESWKRKLQAWSGGDLRILNDAFDFAIGEIEGRLDPINEILRDLPYGTEEDRLRIDMRRLHFERVTEFRKRLRALASNASLDWTDEQADERFRRLRDFMNEIDETAGGSASDREALLDVRRHVEITASRIDEDGRQLSIYSTLGGKSGGESQELAAFIVGAALRYQLGDEARTRPRYAPVLLDEGFVKADGEFTRRAVNAWRALGFQLIIGAPLEKVTGLEPYMDLNLAVTKSQDGYSFVQPFKDANTAVGAVSA